jgi:N-dimethylarginine dimethylaminohydrolase
MGDPRDDTHRYEMTIKMFGAEAEPAFESAEQQLKVWGREWGCDNDVGRLRAVLVHRPGDEMNVVDPSKRIESLGSFGDVEEGWYWQSDTIPPLAQMQAQHDGLVQALLDEGVEVFRLEGVTGGRLKSCYTRDSAIAVKGGVIVTRLAPRVRRGEELAVSRTLAGLGAPILRTLHGTSLFEGGSFAWINSRTAVVGRAMRVNEEGARQVGEVIATHGAELLRVDLVGYDLHIDGSFVMVDVNTALIRASGLPYWFLEKLRKLGVEAIETTPDDDDWIVNCLAVRPGRVLMPEGASHQTLDRLAKRDVEVVTIPFDKMHLNGGGIHCSTCPLARDVID